MGSFSSPVNLRDSPIFGLGGALVAVEVLDEALSY
jgi:hypothetical protein